MARSAPQDFKHDPNQRNLIGGALVALVFLLVMSFMFAAYRSVSAQSACAYVSISRGSDKPIIAELASTARSKLAGMQFRSSFAPADAMIFYYPNPKPVAFWMKDTPIDLDIVFVSVSQRVIGIEHGAKAMTTDPIASPGPVASVIELPAGRARTLPLQVGDAISFDVSSCLHI